MSDDYCAQWRASAHEAVQYSEDLPECFLVLPEPIDGALAQGAATKITISINLGEVNSITVTDNGKGITNTERLLTWASKTSTDVHHRYGHGSKKFLSKWNKNYNCKWHVRYRTCDKKKRSGSLFTYNGPFKGPTMMADEDELDETILMPSGLEWYIEFDIGTLGTINTSKKIFNVVKELLRTRYSRKYFDKTEFIIQVMQDDVLISESSIEAKWKTFKECIDEEVLNGNANIIHKLEVNDDGVLMTYVQYEFLVYGKSKEYTLNKDFPIFGHKNQVCTRLHISLDGRAIELAPLWEFYSGKATSHNSNNGRFAFMNFEGDYNKMPTPCTTKVSFYKHCPNYIKYTDIIKSHNDLADCSCVPKLKHEPKKKEPKKEPSIISKIKDLMKEEQTTQPQPIPTPEPLQQQPPPEPQQEQQQSPPPEPQQEQQQSPIPKPQPQPQPQPQPTPQQEQQQPPPEPLPTPEPTPEPLSTSEPTPSYPTPPPPKPKIPKKVRTETWHKYIGPDIAQHKCLCCKKSTIKMLDFECGHVQSYATGGSQEIDNLRPICKQCNGSMGITNMIDFVKKHGFYIG